MFNSKKSDESLKTADILTLEMLRSWNPCIAGYRRYCELFPKGATLTASIDGLIADGHDDWAYWIFFQARNRNLFEDVVIKGYRNSGNLNSGDLNSGYRNSGNRNSGNRNSGNRNSGNRNSGNRNSGNRNSGNRNSGNRNSGYLNSGDLNSGNRNSGYLNSTDPTVLRVFEKDCPIEVWDNAYKPNFLWFDLTYWVDESDMTDEEKIADPKFFVRGGQLRKRDFKEAFQLSWENADKADRERVRELPNFDAEIFFKISGIDLRNK